jgi:hypothetical protein
MKEHVEVFWFSEQPYGHVTDADLACYPSGRRDFPNTYFASHTPHVLYNQYHEQYALDDAVGSDGIMTNELFGKEVVPALPKLTLQPYD